jgi:acyl carrier protein
MNDAEILSRVKNVLAVEFELEEAELTEDAALYEELGLDSLDSVDLVVALEKEFNFKVERSVDEERIRAIRKLSDIVAFIRHKSVPS